ncbi:E3 SUMO-protein ligase PIAS4b isoform X2 [Oncorhynchus kisutch]|uniref:Protein inhibitor of activated STAT, 4b n=1 Tax=Oncorhynchus kisutch TaxID=8019 RepID=A0A8C7LFL8_ONCKI|nr:E3 SUMO-protein ligase PIAS4-A-like isoform X2 [Oncorhynchus kisutch]
MAGDIAEAIRLLAHLRVTELRSLMAAMGQTKCGLKSNLLVRAVGVIQTQCNPHLLTVVRQLYQERYSDQIVPGSIQTTPVSHQEEQTMAPVVETSHNPTQHTNNLTHNPTQHINSLMHNPTPHTSNLTHNARLFQMVPLPFYQALGTVLPPTQLVGSFFSEMQNQEFNLMLTPKQVEQNRNCKELQPGVPSVQVVLRFCFTESLGYKEDQYPPCLSIKVNQKHIPLPEIHRHCTPINITPTVSLSLLPSFRLCVWWKRCSKRYSVAVYLVKVLSPSDLLSQLKSQSVESLTFCRQRIQEKLRFDPECEVTTTGLQVSLICPLGKMRLSVPCRGRKCSHLQCFDGTFYLQMNEKRPTWTCPVCHELVPYSQLTIDGLLTVILALEGFQDNTEVEYLADGSWRFVIDGVSRTTHPSAPLEKMEAYSASSVTATTRAVSKEVVTVDLTQESSEDEADEVTKVRHNDDLSDRNGLHEVAQGSVWSSMEGSQATCNHLSYWLYPKYMEKKI